MMKHHKSNSQKQSIFSKMSGLAKKHKAINLGQGFPNFEPAEALKNLVSKYLPKNYNQYAPMAGQPELRVALCDKIKLLYGTALNADSNITITAGATQAIFTALTALIKPGDEVIIFEPAYDSYRPTIQLCGGIPKAIPLKAPSFNIPWDDVHSNINDNTKMIIVNNPHNPTGQILNHEDLIKLEQLVADNKLLLLSDEVYEHLVYDDKPHQSVLKYPKLFERSILTFSFGKTFHNTGWKLGYAVAPDSITKAFRDVHQWNVFSVNSFVQMAIAEYLSDQDSYLSLPSFYQKKRDLFNNAMAGSPLQALESSGTYFQLYDYSSISELNDIEFTEWLVREHKIAAIPISPFYTEMPDSKVIRFCFAKTEDVLLEAANLISKV